MRGEERCGAVIPNVQGRRNRDSYIGKRDMTRCDKKKQMEKIEEQRTGGTSVLRNCAARKDGQARNIETRSRHFLLVLAVSNNSYATLKNANFGDRGDRFLQSPHFYLT